MLVVTILFSVAITIYIINNITMAKNTILSFLYSFQKNNDEEESLPYYIMNNSIDSTEVEQPIIERNNNHILFPYDEMPPGIYIDESERDEDNISLYSVDEGRWNVEEAK